MLAAMPAGAALGAERERHNPLPCVGEFDLVVAGGSATGVCAAVTAARAGLKVALIEYNAYFGGMATSALVPVWHSLWSTDGKTKIIGGLTEEIENRMIERGEAKRLNPDNPSVGCYLNVAALQYVLDDFVREAKNVVPFLKCHLVGAIKDAPGHLTHVIVEDKSGRRTLKAKFFIDATGDADLTDRAGFATWRFEKRDMQAHSLCAIVGNVDKLKAKYPAFDLGEVLKPDSGAELKHAFGWLAPVIGAGDSVRFMAFTRVTDCDPSIASDLTAGLLDARAQVKRIIDAVNRKYPMPFGERLVPIAVASDLGVRESRHIVADYKVTAKDVLYGRHFEDLAGKGSYRCDIHEGKGIVFRYLDGHEERMDVDAAGESHWSTGRWREKTAENPTWYEFPLSALRPKGAENLLCAGRMIDCEREAYGALRVMVNCNQMAEAAARVAIKICRGES